MGSAFLLFVRFCIFERCIVPWKKRKEMKRDQAIDASETTSPFSSSPTSAPATLYSFSNDPEDEREPIPSNKKYDSINIKKNDELDVAYNANNNISNHNNSIISRSSSSSNNNNNNNNNNNSYNNYSNSSNNNSNSTNNNNIIDTADNPKPEAQEEETKSHTSSEPLLSVRRLSLKAEKIKFKTRVLFFVADFVNLILRFASSSMRFFSVTDKYISTTKGTDMCLFIRFHRMLFFVSLASSFLIGAPLLIINIVGSITTQSTFWRDLGILSMGSISNNVPLLWTHNALESLIVIGLLLIMAVVLKYAQNTKVGIVRTEYFSKSSSFKSWAALHTIYIKNISRDIVDSAIFQRHFEEQFGLNETHNTSIRAHLALNDRAGILVWMNKKQEWQALLEKAELQAERVESFEKNKIPTIEKRMSMLDMDFSCWPWKQFFSKLFTIFVKKDAVQVLRQRIELADYYIIRGWNSLQGSGVGFVTFDNIKIAKETISKLESKHASYKSSVSEVLNTKHWIYDRAAQPEDINWKGIQTTKRYTLFMAILIYFGLTILFLFMTVSLRSFYGKTYSNILETEKDLKGNLSLVIAVSEQLNSLIQYFFPSIIYLFLTTVLQIVIPFQRLAMKSREKKAMLVVSSICCFYLVYFYPLYLAAMQTNANTSENNSQITGNNFYQNLTQLYLSLS